MNRGSLFIISAPSGAGKTSLSTALVKKLDNIELSISHTSRAKREGEQDGVDYHFVDPDTFNNIVAEARFLECAEVMGSYYGTLQQTVEDRLSSGVDVIVEIDWQGAQQVRRLMPESILIFIMPPSTDELKQRLIKRGRDSEEAIEKLVARAKNEISHFIEYEYLVFNNNFDEALEVFCSIVVSERHKIARQLIDNQSVIRYML